MFGTLKHKGLTLLIIASSLLIGCSSEETSIETTGSNWSQIQGETQGTTYGIILDDPESKIHKEEIDSILHDFDMYFSSYIDSSVIGMFNKTHDTVTFRDHKGHFEWLMTESQKICRLTDGSFDPSVYPLVKAWGFFSDTLRTPSEAELDSLRKNVGFNSEMYYYSNNQNDVPGFNVLSKTNTNFRIDFNAIAQGYSVDVLANYLDENNIKDYYVEIGGEIVVKGKNKENIDWRIGIDSPNQEGTTRVIENVVNISDKAIATSGNYRKFYVKDGVKYAHTIDPKTSAPVQHSLLSATVIADNCTYADAYATAFMVMGVDAAMSFVNSHPELGLDIYLLYDNGSGVIEREMSDGFKKYLK
ncbi:MAG: FAD:protein FMN transferase [Crocinitomicaceae bacterium]